jgi:8-oxo-dGTP diphosphatase
VQAAGGVVARDGRILLVHRPRYDDWSLPKGKLRAGEDHAHAAQREVTEETGVTVRLGPEIGGTRYRDPKGRPKLVRYWLMEPIGDSDLGAVPNDEVDEIRWSTLAEARQLLSYDRDRALIDTLESAD